MLFSIIVPVYNVEKYLAECIESIVGQLSEKADGEIILVDDGSTDRSGVICDEYQRKHPNLIRVFHNANQGLLLTRRYGYKYARGQYIINCDSDDRLEPDMLNYIRSLIRKYNHPDMILFNYYAFDEKSKEKRYTNIFTTERDCQVDKTDILKEFMLHHSVVSLCVKTYKRSCLEINRDYTDLARIGNGEDTLQSVELFNNAITYVYLNESLYDYRIGSGMTRKFDPNYYFGFRTVLECLKKQKKVWKLQDFDNLFAIKVLQTAGRSITQSRYASWESLKEQKEYLKRIKEDELIRESEKYFELCSGKLQKSHRIVLKLLYGEHYMAVILLLRMKNLLGRA